MLFRPLPAGRIFIPECVKRLSLGWQDINARPCWESGTAAQNQQQKQKCEFLLASHGILTSSILEFYQPVVDLYC
jgi:hypothetical protein